MADANYVKFNRRLSKIDRRHRKATSGYVRLVERDGILIPVPDRRVRRGIPFKGLFLTICSFLAFKGFLLAYLGPITYAGRVAELTNGGFGENLASWVLAADPITTFIATQFSLVI